MNKHFKRFIILSSVIMMLGFGCKGLSEEEKNAVRPVTLNYWTVYDDTTLLKEWADKYKQIRPYVTINIRKVRPDTFDTQFVTALADDVGPDIVSMHVHNIGQHRHRLAKMPSSVKVASITVKGKFAKETVVDIQNNAMPTKSQISDRYIDAVSEDAISGGNVYGLPLSVDTLALYYNRDLLDNAGMAEPPKNWEEFRDAVELTTRFDSAGNIVQSGVALGTSDNIDNTFDIFSLLMMQNGVSIAQGNKVTFSSGVNKNTDLHPTTQALRFYTDFARPTKKTYSWNDDMGNAFDAFVRGKSVFYIGFAHDRSNIKARAPQMDLKVIPMPQLNEVNSTNVANYSLQSVVKSSTHQDEAWDFIRYITGSEKVLEYTEKNKLPSPYRSHREQQLQDENLAPFVIHLLSISNWYHGKNVTAAKSAINDLIDDYKKPYPTSSDISPEERDTELITKAARVIQQTY